MLAVYTICCLIGSGETVMQVLLADIDQIHIGQQATLRFSAFNQRATPEVTGHVKTVAADLVNNPQTGERWYTVRIQIKPEELAKLGNLSLLLGMPVEAYIKTSERTALSYLINPLADQVNKSTREE